MKFKLLLFLLSFLICSNVWAGIDFDGVDDIVNYGDVAAAEPVSFSISAWVYHDSLTTDDTILTKTTPNTLDEGFLLFRDDVAAISGRTDTYVNYVEESDGATTCRLEGATNASPSENWTHVVGTYTEGSSTGMRLYVNGVEDANSPASSASCTGLVNAGNLLIGDTNAPTNLKPFDGKITEVAMWNVVLTQAQVSQLALSRVKRMPLQISPSNLIFYSPLDDQPDGTSFDGDTALDYDATANNGTGDNGANNTGLTAKAEEVLSYP